MAIISTKIQRLQGLLKSALYSLVNFPSTVIRKLCLEQAISCKNFERLNSFHLVDVHLFYCHRSRQRSCFELPSSLRFPFSPYNFIKDHCSL